MDVLGFIVGGAIGAIAAAFAILTLALWAWRKIALALLATLASVGGIGVVLAAPFTFLPALFPAPFLLIGFVSGGLATAVLLMLLWRRLTRPPASAFVLPTAADVASAEPPGFMLISIGKAGAHTLVRQLHELQAAGRESSVGSILIVLFNDRHRNEILAQVPEVFRRDRLVWPSAPLINADFEGRDDDDVSAARPEWEPAIDEAVGRVFDLHLRRNSRPPALIASYLEPGAEDQLARRALDSVTKRFTPAVSIGFVVLSEHRDARLRFRGLRDRLAGHGVDTWVLGDATEPRTSPEMAVLGPLAAAADPQNELSVLLRNQQHRVLFGSVVRSPVPARRTRWLFPEHWASEQVLLNCAVHAVEELERERPLHEQESAIDFILATIKPRDVDRLQGAVSDMLRSRDQVPAVPGAGGLARPITRPNYRLHVHSAARPLKPAGPTGDVVAVRLKALSPDELDLRLETIKTATAEPIAPITNGSSRSAGSRAGMDRPEVASV